MKRKICLLVGTVLLAACSADDDSDQNISIDDDTVPGEGEVALMSPDGATLGAVEYREEASGMQLRVSVEGLTPGEHAVHLHETGDCSADDFSSAGGHWNPMGKEHGRDNPAGAHLGDLANMNVGEDGSGSATYLVTGVSFATVEPAMRDADGTALVIHAGPDDYVTDPAGDAGPRVACAVLAQPA